MQIISERQMQTEVYYALDFYKDGEICLSFRCDNTGNVFTDGLQPGAIINLRGATERNLVSRVNRYTDTFTEPAVG